MFGRAGETVGGEGAVASRAGGITAHTRVVGKILGGGATGAEGFRETGQTG